MKSKKHYKRSSEKKYLGHTIFSLAWDVIGYETLFKQNGNFKLQMSS